MSINTVVATIRYMPEHARGPAFELHRRVLQEVALKGWTKSELRHKTGVARSTVEAWATQPRPPQPRTVNAVADALGIDRTEALRLAGILDETPGREEQMVALDEFERAVLAADLPESEKEAAILRHRELAREQLAELGLDVPVPSLVRRAVRAYVAETDDDEEQHSRGA